MEDLFSTLMGDINNSMASNGAEKEQFDISAVYFIPNACGDDDWFCESKIRHRIFEGVADGVTRVANERSNVKWVNNVKESESDGFYKKFRSLPNGAPREKFLISFAKSHASTVLIFGRYKGDDFDMELQPFMYYSNRGSMATGDKKRYTRKMSDNELIEQISKTIRDMLLETLDG